MREPLDALRSVKKYVAEILSPQPPLALIEWTGLSPKHFTVAGQVVGATSVSKDAWGWLQQQSRMSPTVVGTPADPTTYYLASDLIGDPTVAAAAAGIDLTGAVVTTPGIASEPEWEVRLWFDPGEVPDGVPYARVTAIGALGLSGPSLYYEATQPISIECSPVPAETADQAVLDAMAVQTKLLDGFRGEGVGLGRPLRIPLYDYSDVTMLEAASDRHTSDFMRVVDFSVRLLPNPQDPSRVGVVADLRVSWRRDNEPRRGTRHVESVDLTEATS